MSDSTTLPPGRATNNGNTRVTGKEQYYTPPTVAKELTGVMLSLVTNPLKRPWLEPAAGTGSFTNAMREVGITQIHAYDLYPKASGITQGDFLKTQLAFTGGVCLTNPPFGRNNSLSVPFFNHAAKHCDFIGFIVPKSWRKWSVINRLDPGMHLVYDQELTLNYIDEHGAPLSEASLLRTVFQVWERRDVKRSKMGAVDRGYITKTTPEEADVALTVFGRGCGTVSTSFERRKVTTQMYLKASPEVIEALKAIDFSGFYNNVAFVEALSLPEINHCLNAYFDAKDR